MCPAGTSRGQQDRGGGDTNGDQPQVRGAPLRSLTLYCVIDTFGKSQLRLSFQEQHLDLWPSLSTALQGKAVVAAF